MRPYTHEPDKLRNVSEAFLRDEAIMSRDQQAMESKVAVAQTSNWKLVSEIKFHDDRRGTPKKYEKVDSSV